MEEGYIYLIINRNNNKKYIGSTKGTINKRVSMHRHELKENKHINTKLQEDFNAGHEFIYRMLEQCSLEDLLVREQYWLDYFGGLYAEDVYNEVNPLALHKKIKNELEEIDGTISNMFKQRKDRKVFITPKPTKLF